MRDVVAISDVRMVIEKQSMDSLVDKDEQKPDFSKQTCQLLPSNIQYISTFIEEKYAINRKNVGPFNNSLSTDIQQEAADFLLQLKKQSRSLDPTDRFMYKKALGKTTINIVAKDVPVPRYLAYPGILLFSSKN